MFQTLRAGLVDLLGLDENDLSPRAWGRGLWAFIKCYTPGTHERRVWLALTRGYVIYAAPDGCLAVCRLKLEWADQHKQQAAPFFIAAVNAEQLEPAALAYLVSMGKSLDRGQFIVCPKWIASQALWGALAEA